MWAMFGSAHILPTDPRVVACRWSAGNADFGASLQAFDHHSGLPPSFGPVAVRVVGFDLMGALPSVVDGCEVSER